MGQTHGTKQRIIERNRYRPQRDGDANRFQRVVGNNGKTETYKHPGDIIIDSTGKKTEVTEYGWN